MMRNGEPIRSIHIEQDRCSSTTPKDDKLEDCKNCKHELGTVCKHPKENEKGFYSQPIKNCFQKRQTIPYKKREKINAF